MPLVQYFAVVGSILLALCWGARWYFPEPDRELAHSDIDKSAVRIRSVEKLPERVVIDTSLPTIVPPQTFIAIANEPPRAATKQTEPGTRLAASNPTDAVPKKQNIAKRNSLKKVAIHQAAPSGNTTVSSSTTADVTAPIIRMSLIDIVKERLTRSLFN
jgi:hypothetical protein